IGERGLKTSGRKMRGRNTHGTPRFIRLGNDLVVVVEEVECTREIESIFREYRGFICGSRLMQRLFKPRGESGESPDLVAAFAGENFIHLCSVCKIWQKGINALAFLAKLSEDRIRTYCRILAEAT